MSEQIARDWLAVINFSGGGGSFSRSTNKIDALANVVRSFRANTRNLQKVQP